MKKNTILIILPGLFVFLFVGLPMQSYQLNTKSELSYANCVLDYLSPIEQPKNKGKNLLKGVWGRADGPGEINISEVLDNGVLKATFYNPKLINMEKAVWTNSSDVLRIYILLRDDSNPGSGFSLNYSPEKDLLVGAYFDALTNESYPVTFKRVK
jgi:hypothetical protein